MKVSQLRPRAERNTSVFGPLLCALILGVFPSASSAQPEAAFVHTPGCTAEQATRLHWSVRYMRAAASSNSYEDCVENAIVREETLNTSQEHTVVGPYHGCFSNNVNVRDPEYVWIFFPGSNFYNIGVLRGIAKNLPRENDEDENGLILECREPDDEQVPGDALYFSPSTTARNFGLLLHDIGHWKSWFAWDYFEERDNREHYIQFNINRVFGDFPDHVDGETIDPLYGNLGDSYPVDELAGIIMHEMTHTIGFEHQSSCGTNYHRRQSFPEIVEACMSEVVQESIEQCDESMCPHPYQLPIYDWLGGYQCHCKFAF
ncbi:MAG: hypothetical protein AAGM22_23025 [Acidobacteriota bacterium]